MKLQSVTVWKTPDQTTEIPTRVWVCDSLEEDEIVEVLERVFSVWYFMDFDKLILSCTRPFEY